MRKWRSGFRNLIIKLFVQVSFSKVLNEFQTMAWSIFGFLLCSWYGQRQFLTNKKQSQQVLMHSPTFHSATRKNWASVKYLPLTNQHGHKPLTPWNGPKSRRNQLGPKTPTNPQTLAKGQGPNITSILFTPNIGRSSTWEEGEPREAPGKRRRVAARAEDLVQARKLILDRTWWLLCTTNIKTNQHQLRE